MPSISVRTPAKVNLCLDIKGLRPDGYHEIESIFQSISLEDELLVCVEESNQNSFSIELANPALKKLIPLDKSNLIGKALDCFMSGTCLKGNFAVKVHLEKRIPVGAGLAGGSANAAGMLLALNQLFGTPFSFAELLEVSASIGSDVPFCLKGGSSFVRGRGEILETIETNLTLSYCLLKPRKLSVSTPWAYESFDNYKGDLPAPQAGIVKDALLANDPEQLLSGMANVFEPVVFAKHPELESLKKQMLDLGAWHCQMTGSGPTLFALVAGRAMGHHLRRQILKDDEIGFIYGSEEIIMEAVPPIDFRLAETVNHGAYVLESENLHPLTERRDNVRQK